MNHNATVTTTLSTTAGMMGNRFSFGVKMIGVPHTGQNLVSIVTDRPHFKHLEFIVSPTPERFYRMIKLSYGRPS